MDVALKIIKIVCGCIAITLAFVRLKHDDKHTAIYWTIVAAYWFISFADSVLK